MNKIAYSYLRFSSAEQAKGDSERRQNKKFSDYCKSNGLTPASDNFADRGRSGFKGEHLDDTGELRRFLRLVESGEIAPGSTLVVESLDRLSRQDVEDALAVFLSILGAGIRIVTLGDGEGARVYVKGGGVVPIIMSLLEMSRAHGESQRKSDLVSAAFANKQALARETYKPMGKWCPLWLRLKPGWRNYEQDGSGYEEIQERADVVRRIFQWTIDGYGRSTIVRMLNQEGVPSFKADIEKLQANGLKGWGTSSVDKVLKNRAVFGEYQPKTSKGAVRNKKLDVGDPIPGYYPTVVSVEVFYEAQAAIDGRRTAKATKQSKRFNLWQGIGKCERCGGNLHQVNKGAPPKGGSYLRCENQAKGVCKAKSVRLEQADAVFRGMLLRLDTLALVKDGTAEIEKALRAKEGQLVESKRRQKALEQRLDEFPESASIGRLVNRADDEVKALQREVKATRVKLAAESGIGWEEFLRRLDLETYEGRARANALVKRMGIVVLVGVSGYGVTENGNPLFGMDFREGEAGYLIPGFGGALPAFMPVSEVPRWGEAEAASEARYDAIEDEGQSAGEY